MLQQVSALPVQGNLFLTTPKTPTQTPGVELFTVLLAEDDEDLRCVMEHTLIAMGYVVIACADAYLASDAFHNQGNIDILLTDFEMPGRSGVELAKELTSARPNLPVMIVTGTILSSQTMGEIRKRGWVYVSKPCNLSALQVTLGRLLTSRLTDA